MGWSQVIKTLASGALNGAVSNQSGDGEDEAPYFAPLGGDLAPLPATESERNLFGNLKPIASSDSAKPPLMSSIAASPVDTITPTARPTPRTYLDRALSDYYNAQNSAPPKLSRGRAALSGLALAGLDIPNMMSSRNIDDNSAFGMSIGDALSRVIGGLIAPGATARQVKQVRENKALGDLQTAQAIYDKDVQGRLREQQIESADAMEAKNRAWEQTQKDKNDIDQLEALTKIYKSSPAWKSGDNMAFNELLSKLAGAKIVLPDKGPKVKVHFKEDAGSDLLWMMKVDENGNTISSDYVRDANGEPVKFQNPRVKQALIQSAGSLERTKITDTTKRLEIKQRAEQFTKRLNLDMEKLDVDKKKAIQDSVDKNMKTWEETQATQWLMNGADEDTKASQRAAQRAFFLQQAAKQYGIETTPEEE